jgi:KaiC/GvpD/RAD55 family RecA-like ATPase
MKKIKTHINGLDEILDGGIISNSKILLSGNPGTGKTIMALEMINNMIEKNNSKVIYLSFEEKKESLIDQAKQFGWDLKKLEKKNKLRIIDFSLEKLTKSNIEEIWSIIEEFKTELLIIDSLTTLIYLIPKDDEIINEFEIKRYLYKFFNYLNNIPNVIKILISQKEEKIIDTFARYSADGIINIDYEPIEENVTRYLSIPKLRKAKNKEGIYSMQITNKGIKISNIE